MTSELIFILSVIGLAVVLVFGLSIFQKQTLKRQIKQEWGKLPRVTHHDKEASLKDAWLLAKTAEKPLLEIDDITWHDLDLIHVFEQLNATKSSVGAELLYQRLRHLDENEQAGEELSHLLSYFKQEPANREKAQYLLANLGKKDHNQLWYYLTNPQKRVMGNGSLVNLLGALPLVLLVGLLLTSQLLFAYGLIASILLNLVLYQVIKSSLERELTSMNYLVNTIWLGPKLSQLSHPLQVEMRELSEKLRVIQLMGFAFRVKNGSEMELMFEYLTAIFLLPLISYNLVLTRIKHQQQSAIDLVKLIGTIDMAIAILNFKEVMPYTTVPVFHQELVVSGTGMYHPLLSHPVANEVTWDRFTLVTGSNASGKSTYIKGVALNCILAQTIGVVCSQTWAMRRGKVLSSMALEDNLFEGDSYFVAEIKSVKRIVNQVKRGETVYCFIDEILRGTNTVERISASAAIISWLAHFPSLGFVASHDNELTEILKAETANIHFSESVTQDDGIAFDYLLKQGPARTRNALRLLEIMDYPEMIVEKAEAKAQYFDENQSWQ